MVFQPVTAGMSQPANRDWSGTLQKSVPTKSCLGHPIRSVVELAIKSFCSALEVKAMDPSRRKCLLQTEKHVPEMNVAIEAFDIYTKSNCLLECR